MATHYDANFVINAFAGCDVLREVKQNSLDILEYWGVKPINLSICHFAVVEIKPFGH